MSTLDCAERHLLNSVDALTELADRCQARHADKANEMLGQVEDVLATVRKWKAEAEQERER